jgi:hypothetical protein
MLLVLGVGVVCGWYLLVGANGQPKWDSLATVALFLGGSLTLTSLLLAMLPRNLALLLASTQTTALIATGLLAAAGVDPFHLYHRARVAWFPPEIGIWKFDPELGFAHIPSATGEHESVAYKVLYTIDPLGFRITPDPAEPRGRVTFLGCSFAFGTGVEDEEPFPYLLGRDHWPDLKVRNRGVSGYGTSHVYLSLLRELEEAEKPVMVFYPWIPLHRHRNYIRKDWVGHLGRPWTAFEEERRIQDQRKHPHFEIEGEKLVFKGVVGPEDIGLDPPDLIEKEEALSKRLLIETARLAETAGVPFLLLVLAMPDPYDLPDYLTEAIEESGVEYLDLRSIDRGFLSHDFHPNPETHRALARAIAEATPVVEILNSRQAP